ncbi:MAG TPA: alpha/beta hydrolase [Methylomirabilota bacterium]|nr:alpha/beta hydrolase [Methylomirabilota bacterium]
MNRFSLLCPLLLAIPLMAFAQSHEPIPLWPGGAPGALGKEDHDIPTLTPYVPDGPNRTRAGIVVCPGGGYGRLAPHEGRDYALWLNRHGISAFVLKYRLGTHGYRHPAMLQDAARALRTVRARSGDWDLDPDRIGIMGSSAGGHLASTLLTHFEDGDRDSSDPIERVSSRPDLGILCYPVITMGPDTHTGSRNNLLGRDPDPELIALLSNERQVTDRTPPCFIWHTWEDKGVKAVNSLEFAAALNRAGVPFDLHVFEQGRHGIGLADSPPFDKAHPWAENLLFWLKARGFLD